MEEGQPGCAARRQGTEALFHYGERAIDLDFIVGGHAGASLRYRRFAGSNRRVMKRPKRELIYVVHAWIRRFLYTVGLWAMIDAIGRSAGWQSTAVALTAGIAMLNT